MTEYILLIHDNTVTPSTAEEWDRFFASARQSGMFKGGSEIGRRETLGGGTVTGSSAHIVGYMRFDTDDKGTLLELLTQHPVLVHGGTVELCELPRS